MPLPDSALTITGGCTCTRFQYRMHIPPAASRPNHPNFDASKAPGLTSIKLPYVFTDQCTDCRSALGAILPAYICGSLDTVEVRYKSSRVPTPPEDYSPWIPATPFFTGPDSLAKVAPDAGLSFYSTSPGVQRSFCGNCGSCLTYHSQTALPSILDINLATVDGEYLNTDAMRPERHLWWDEGIPWVKGYLDNGDGEWDKAGNEPAERHTKMDMNSRMTF